MIERGSGRTSGLTDWHRMDVNSMWACLQDHDTTNHWKQVAGWRKICDLAQTHLSRLQEYRRGLAEAWPPATNAAARAYLAELDELIDKVRRTHDAAAANYTALAAATQAISGTRARLKTIHEEYAAKLQQKQAYEATAADPKAAMGSRVPDRPVTDADLEQLNVQARGIMYGLSGELQQAQVTLQRPPSVKPKVDAGTVDSGVGALQAPSIPPVIPVAMPSPGAAGMERRPHESPRKAAMPVATGIGPVLGAASTGTAPHAVSPTPPSATPTTASPGPFPTLGTGIGTPSLPTHRPEAAGLNRGHLERPGAIAPTAPHGEAPSAQPGARSSVIGAPGGVGPARGSDSQSRRVNPFGGLIGGGGAGTAPAGAAGSRPSGSKGTYGLSPMNGMPIGPRQDPHIKSALEDRDERNRSHWDPDDPWRTAKGVDPVVLPPDENGPPDPGPAIGIDR
ncbi:hypothetical protein [Micromonospora globbae]|uniref:hypothetical protein n=1 Tax=Micromonospora globbae TaxID=1894969 RepID=UPI003448A50A